MDNLNIVLVLSLLTLGFLSSWFAAIKDNDNAIQLSLSSLTLAVVFALDNVIPLLYSYMRMHFPLSISLILTGFAVLGVVLFVFFSPFIFMDDNGNISIKNALKFCELQAMNGGQTLLRRKYKYLLKSEGDELGEVKLTNPIAIGEVIKIVSKAYRIADIWHSEVVSVAYVEKID